MRERGGKDEKYKWLGSECTITKNLSCSSIKTTCSRHKLSWNHSRYWRSVHPVLAHCMCCYRTRLHKTQESRMGHPKRPLCMNDADQASRVRIQSCLTYSNDLLRGAKAWVWWVTSPLATPPGFAAQLPQAATQHKCQQEQEGDFNRCLA